MMATRLYQNTARVHFNLHAEKDGRFGRRIIFGFFFFKQKTAYEISSRDWSSDVCSSDLIHDVQQQVGVRRLLQRRLERVDEAVRQVADEIGRASCRERVCELV